jgi:hypothetical protein
MEVEIILDSIINDTRILTIRAKYPRCIHAEVLKHRNCAVSAASSRAIPVSKMIEMVENTPFIPSYIGAEQKGMSPGGELSVIEDHNARTLIQDLLLISVSTAKRLAALGVHKSVINRYLEPWLEINTLTTAGMPHWNSFYALRSTKEADPIARELAIAIQAAIDSSEPVEREAHMPYTDFVEISMFNMGVSAARCARLSYTPFGEPARDKEKDWKLACKLLAQNHATPFEHVVLQPCEGEEHGCNAISSKVLTFREWLENTGDLPKLGRRR